ncbi:MAG: efflux RND transporter periplasmic adaptor subunit [Pseudomonadota bacterium]
MRLVFLIAMVAAILDSCAPNAEDAAEFEQPVRGLITRVVEAEEDTTVRRYPGVLEPGEVNVLSFEVGGRLGRLDLAVGQRVAEGELLASLDAAAFFVTLENRRASVEEAQVALEQAQENYERSEALLQSGAITRVRRDEDETEFQTAQARLTQAEQDLASAQEDLEDADLHAPFDAIVNSVDADSFATVAAGEAVLSVYSEADYEVSFSVNFEVASQLVVGKEATVRLADDPDVALAATVRELGERAETVSSFPVVVRLEETDPLIKPGMAVEVSFEFDLPGDRGFLIPISAAIPEGEIPDTAGTPRPTPLLLYVFDPESSTVKRREVTFAGLRENHLVVIEGLSPGERVAVAGVSFLRDGMEVKLVDRPE